jgi:hypothetical protein
VLVPGIVLNNKYRSHAALFAADNRTQVGVINISSFNSAKHKASLSDEFVVTAVTSLCNRVTIILSQRRIKYTQELFRLG